MKIISLELHKYVRLYLSNIQKISIRFDADTHLFIGSNGSGKSSVMAELSPLPADRDFYDRGGYKQIIIEDNGSTYVLTSDFSEETPTYSFLKDSIEQSETLKLNEYKRLVYQTFKINQEIFDLMSGGIKFSNMRGGELRHWITRLSDVDLTYALQYYKRLTEEIRDVTGAIKQQQSRLGIELAKLTTPEQEAELKERADKLHAVYLQLLECKQNNSTADSSFSTEGVKLSLISNVNAYKSLLNQYSQLDINLDDQQLSDGINQTHTKIAVLDNELGKTFERVEKLEKSLAAISDEKFTAHEGGSMYERLPGMIQQLQQSVVLPIAFTDPITALNAASAVAETFLSIINCLPANPGMAVSKQSYIDNLKKYQTQSELHSSLLANRDKLLVRQKELEHCLKHNSVQCPECNHQWTHSYDERAHKFHLKLIAEVTEAIDDGAKRLETLKQTLDEEETYLSQSTQLSQLMRSWQILQPFWEHVIQTRLIWTNPSSLTHAFNDLKEDLKTHIEIERLQKEYAQLSLVKEQFAQSQAQSIEQVKQLYEQGVLEVTEQQKQLRGLKQYLTKLTTCTNIRAQLAKLKISLENIVERWDAYTGSLHQKNYNRYIGECIYAVQLEEGTYRQQINRVDAQKSLVEDIKAQIETLTQKQDLLKLAEASLSPVDGLIAKGLTNFINRLIAQMNAFTSTVWLTPLEISPVLPDADGLLALDYKFSLSIGESGINVPDLRKASAGQLDIINRAFCVVAMNYLGLADSPLYFDEFGAQMDHAHKARAAAGVRRLMDVSNFSQVFIISHHENSYANMVNAGITVMCPSNIVLPKDLAYNATTVIS